eukprot:5249201-Prymnesium_polylepis.1
MLRSCGPRAGRFICVLPVAAQTAVPLPASGCTFSSARTNYRVIRSLSPESKANGQCIASTCVRRLRL